MILIDHDWGPWHRYSRVELVFPKMESDMIFCSRCQQMAKSEFMFCCGIINSMINFIYCPDCFSKHVTREAEEAEE